MFTTEALDTIRRYHRYRNDIISHKHITLSIILDICTRLIYNFCRCRRHRFYLIIVKNSIYTLFRIDVVLLGCRNRRYRVNILICLHVFSQLKLSVLNAILPILYLSRFLTSEICTELIYTIFNIVYVNY